MLNLFSLLIGLVTLVMVAIAFIPPLVKDGAPHTAAGPLNPGRTAPLVYSLSDPTDLAFLRNDAPGPVDLRFSIRSLPIYTMGVLDLVRPGSTIPIDGVAGPHTVHLLVRYAREARTCAASS